MEGNTDLLSHRARVVKQSATEFFDSLRTATDEQVEHIRQEAANKGIGPTSAGQESLDLSIRFAISNNLFDFRQRAASHHDLKHYFNDAVPYIRKLRDTEYKQSGSAETCSKGEALTIAKSVFYPDPPQTSVSVNSSEVSAEDEMSTGAGVWIPPLTAQLAAQRGWSSLKKDR